MSSTERPLLLYGETYHHPNIFYRTGFIAPDPIVVIDRGGDDVTLWASSLEEGRARKEARVKTVRCTSELTFSGKMKDVGNDHDAASILLETILQEHGITSVDVDGDFPVRNADYLREHGIDVHTRGDLFQRERRIKTADEIAWITETENAGMAALQKAIDAIAAAEIRDGLLYRDGTPLSGNDLIFTVESSLLENNCTTADSICCGGPESANPHCLASPVLRVGLPIVLDIYPFHKKTRYWGDMTRTVVRGTPPPEVDAMWEAVLEAQQAGLDAVRPGVNARDVHRACCEVFKKRGYASLGKDYRDIPSTAKFIHGTGHGLGLEIHEFPRVGDLDEILEEGDVVTVEPGLYDPQFGGIRIEDLVVVTKDGCRNLTTLPKVFHLD